MKAKNILTALLLASAMTATLVTSVFAETPTPCPQNQADCPPGYQLARIHPFGINKLIWLFTDCQFRCVQKPTWETWADWVDSNGAGWRAEEIEIVGRPVFVLSHPKKERRKSHVDTATDSHALKPLWTL